MKVDDARSTSPSTRAPDSVLTRLVPKNGMPRPETSTCSVRTEVSRPLTIRFSQSRSQAVPSGVAHCRKSWFRAENRTIDSGESYRPFLTPAMPALPSSIFGLRQRPLFRRPTSASSRSGSSIPGKAKHRVREPLALHQDVVVKAARGELLVASADRLQNPGVLL